MTDTSHAAHAGRRSAARTLGQPIYTSVSDTCGHVDLDALKAAGLNSESCSKALLELHRKRRS
jgi:hypothetical protein